MKLNRLHHAILQGIATDLAYWQSPQRQRPDRGDVTQLSRWDRAATQAKRGFVELNLPDWLGCSPTPSERTMASRAYRKLAAAGFIVGENYGGWSENFTHLALTDAGRAIVDALSRSSPPSANDAAVHIAATSHVQPEGPTIGGTHD